MPTGYTAGIEDGSITSAKDFLMLCTRAFGIVQDMRDDPLTVPTPLEFKQNQWYVEKYEQQLALVNKIKSMSLQEMREKYLKYFSESLLSKQHFIQMMTDTNNKYYPILHKIISWNPPEVFQPIKEFAIDQIKMCMYRQEDIDRNQRELDEYKASFDDSEDSILDFRENMLEHETQCLETYKRNMDNDLQKAIERTKFMQDFVKSLEQLE